MYQRKTTLIQSLLLATLLSNVFIVSACSAESSSTPVLSNQKTPTEIYELGLAYYEGDSVPEDDDKAFELFEKAANQNYALAQHYLGIMYENGKGIDQNYKKAMQWYLLSANNMDSSSASVDAQGNIGTMYYFGRGVPQSYTEALKWYKKSAAQDLDIAQLNIGDLYENGYGVPQDYDKAFEWYQKAADQGNQEASNRIGRLVMNGKIDDKGITIFSTQETGLTLGDLEDELNG